MEFHPAGTFTAKGKMGFALRNDGRIPLDGWCLLMRQDGNWNLDYSPQNLRRKRKARLTCTLFLHSD